MTIQYKVQLSIKIIDDGPIICRKDEEDDLKRSFALRKQSEDRADVRSPPSQHFAQSVLLQSSYRIIYGCLLGL